MPKLIADMGRMPSAGRLRFGKAIPKAKGNGMRPTAVSEWIVTSNDQKALEQLAEIYGGSVKPWESQGGKGGHDWIVETTSRELAVVLPADPLDVEYSLYDPKKGYVRSCDGHICEVPVIIGSPDGDQISSDLVDCVCRAENVQRCKLKVTLRVLLPEVRFAGAWVLQSGSANAAEEMTGFVAIIQQMQERGMTKARLTLDKRSSMTIQGGRNYVVPGLAIDATLTEIAAGAAGKFQSIESGPNPAVAALDAGADYIDVEVVEDDGPMPGPQRDRKALVDAVRADSRRLKAELAVDAEMGREYRDALDELGVISAGKTLVVDTSDETLEAWAQLNAVWLSDLGMS